MNYFSWKKFVGGGGRYIFFYKRTILYYYLFGRCFDLLNLKFIYKIEIKFKSINERIFFEHLFFFFIKRINFVHCISRIVNFLSKKQSFGNWLKKKKYNSNWQNDRLHMKLDLKKKRKEDRFYKLENSWMQLSFWLNFSEAEHFGKGLNE